MIFIFSTRLATTNSSQQSSSQITSQPSQTSSSTDNLIANVPPTAYIVPSRINSVKVNPMTTNRPATSINLNSSFPTEPRRTAAVQPTPHDAGISF